MYIVGQCISVSRQVVCVMALRYNWAIHFRGVKAWALDMSWSGL
jgi:hypothetical protein